MDSIHKDPSQHDRLAPAARHKRGWAAPGRGLAAGLGLVLVCIRAWGGDVAPPLITGVTVTNGQAQVNWAPYPAAVRYRIYRAGDPAASWMEDASGAVAGFAWTGSVGVSNGFLRLGVDGMTPDALLTATVLNRLAYGPTPDDLDRVRAIGPQAYIDEQMAPELIAEDLDIDQVVPIGGWRQVTVAGTATASTLYVYLLAPGDLYVDDLVLVAGTNAAVGANLLRNGDFETALDTNDWVLSANLTNTSISGALVHAGAGSLHLVATAAGSTQGSSVWQAIKPSLTNGQAYTLSYWYYAPADRASDLIVRLSGSGINAPADATVPLRTRLENDWASLSDLRAWHVLHAVRARRQLVEVLDQLLENHFVTQQSKSRTYLGQYYNDSTQTDRRGTRMEYVENRRWREALLNPACTFHDLLEISATSPAMIIYLDTVTSRGDGGRIANENYARELMELFCMGVDNGYDQTNIVEMSRIWTGWRIRLVDATNEFNPAAPQSTTIVPGSTNTSLTTVSNLVGVWAFNYQPSYHNTNSKTLFAGRTVPARFGAPYTTKLYGANTVPGAYPAVIPGRSGPAGMQEGEEALAYLADLPFTQEFISVKLCRLLVHDGFVHGAYDYTDPDLSPEGQLVRQCMLAWENNSPRGQIRKVLDVILRSDLFRGHAASLQKVKTPLEFTVSAIRALRTAHPNGTFTADTDGYGLAAPLGRMGGMNLFDRGDPDGYPESGAGWISAGTLAERLRFVQAFSIASGQGGRTDAGNCVCNPVALLEARLPAASWSEAGAVVDCFLGLLFPGEGQANLDLYRTAALNYLNAADDGRAASPFVGLAPGTTAYDTRVRSLVGMLLGAQRFQEQ